MDGDNGVSADLFAQAKLDQRQEIGDVAAEVLHIGIGFVGPLRMPVLETPDDPARRLVKLAVGGVQQFDFREMPVFPAADLIDPRAEFAGGMGLESNALAVVPKAPVKLGGPVQMGKAGIRNIERGAGVFIGGRGKPMRSAAEQGIDGRKKAADQGRLIFPLKISEFDQCEQINNVLTDMLGADKILMRLVLPSVVKGYHGVLDGVMEPPVLDGQALDIGAIPITAAGFSMQPETEIAIPVILECARGVHRPSRQRLLDPDKPVQVSQSGQADVECNLQVHRDLQRRDPREGVGAFLCDALACLRGARGGL